MAATQPKAALSAAQATVTTPAETAVSSKVPTQPKIALPLAMADDARIEPIGDDGCPIGCKTRCCGSMACCTPGVLPGPSVLSLPLFRTVTLIPRDVAGRSGTGPEALPKPPRTLA
jgi:hypothetical protein